MHVCDDDGTILDRPGLLQLPALPDRVRLCMGSIITRVSVNVVGVLRVRRREKEKKIIIGRARDSLSCLSPQQPSACTYVVVL